MTLHGITGTISTLMQTLAMASLCCIVIGIYSVIYFPHDYSYTIAVHSYEQNSTTTTVYHMSTIVMIEQKEKTVTIFHKDSITSSYTFTDKVTADRAFNELSLLLKQYHKRKFKFL